MIRFEDLRVRDQNELDRDFFNRRFRLIAEALGQLSDDVASVTSDTDRLVALGLNRVNEVLGPLLSKVQAASENGFLVATSTTPLTISLGLETTLVVTEGDERELFTPTPYVMLARTALNTQADYALLRVQAYNRDSGGLAFKVVSLSGNIGAASYSDWVVSASAGISLQVLQASSNIEDTLVLAEQAAADAADAAATAQSVLASGPVSSVNGKAGTVVLGMSDIAGLVSAIAAKADSNHGHPISAISNLQSTLDALADGGTY